MGGSFDSDFEFDIRDFENSPNFPENKKIYYHHGFAIHEFTKAILTMDPKQINAAISVVKTSITISNRRRRHDSVVESIRNIIVKPDYDLYTDEQAHAEIVYAECHLIKATLLGLKRDCYSTQVLEIICIKNAYQSYKHCTNMLREKTNWEDSCTRECFETGVRLGMAIFNVMLSTLPPRLIAASEFAGFSGDAGIRKDYGIKVLMSEEVTAGAHSVMSCVTILVYHLLIGQIAGISPNVALSQYLITEYLEKYPSSAWLLTLKGRLEILIGLSNTAVNTYTEIIALENLRPHLLLNANWESMFANAIMGNWPQCIEHGLRLVEDDSWPTQLSTYMILAASLQQGIPVTKENIEECIWLTNCHNRTQRGRTVPMREFLLRRCERLRSRGHLVLPATEVLFLWNWIPFIVNDQKNANRILRDIEDTYKKVRKSLGRARRSPIYDADDLNLLRYMMGTILHNMGFPVLALEYLKPVLGNKGSLIENTHLIPYTLTEIAICYYQLDNKDIALRLINAARQTSLYKVETRFQTRLDLTTEAIRHNLVPKRIRRSHSYSELDILDAPKAQRQNKIKVGPVHRAICPLDENKDKEKDTRVQMFGDPDIVNTKLESRGFTIVKPRPLSPVAGPSRCPDMAPK